ESYISAFCENFNLRAWITRFPNVVGERATHGAMFDFMNRLEKNPQELQILGDGTQTKPYVYVKDLISAILFIWKNTGDKLNIFNAGVESSTSVTRIAEIVAEEMGLKNVRFKYTGGDRGWVGDVPRFQYDLSRIHQLGWKAEFTSDEALRTAVKAEIAKRAG
ncbi:MAG: NAD-dependent epimerase/dehydratase family protein, partial [Spirochaetia bacterium]|nr:NAD-dependent epimerase/dehydratase family protein [Spirochaetia bacterium]